MSEPSDLFQMEQGGTELEFDEWDKLLGDYSEAFSDGNCLFANSNSMHINSPIRSFIEKPENHESLVNGGISPNPVDESLAAAFSQMMINNEIAISKECPAASMSNQPNNPSLMNTQFPNVVYDNGYQSSRLYEPIANDEYFTDIHAYPFITNAQAPGMGLPITPDQDQLFMDPQTHCPPWSDPFQLNQHQIRIAQMEEYHRLHEQYLCLQQLCSSQANGNAANRVMNQTSYMDLPISHQLEQYYEEPVWDSEVLLRREFDKLSRSRIPEKILMRSNRSNSVRANAIRFGSVGGSELFGTKKLLLNTRLTGDIKHGFDLRLPPPKYNSVDDVRGRIYMLAKDQNGCRFLQRKFTEGTPGDIEKIFVEIIDHIVELMVDPFGNYLVQKLLEVCDETQRMQILCAITRNPRDIIKISCDMHGTRAIQKVMETLTSHEQFYMVVSFLKPGVMTLIKNMNGNHVAQRCLQYFAPEYSRFVFDAAIANCVELAADRHGCCVVQKCLAYSNPEQKRRLVCEIIANAVILSQDPYGNYVVQYIFQLELSWAEIEVLEQLEGHYGDLSMQKYSSNVVERCLENAGEEQRARIIQELINHPRLDQIMQDPYGNYVVQTASRITKGAVHAALVDAMRPLVPLLKASPFGKKILTNRNRRNNSRMHTVNFCHKVGNQRL